MKARTRLTLALTLLSIAAGTAAANGQDTRAEEIRRKQSERQQRVVPPRPTMVERAIDRLEQWGFISGQPRGVYPWLGSIYPGGGVGAGAGVRKEFGDARSKRDAADQPHLKHPPTPRHPTARADEYDAGALPSSPAVSSSLDQGVENTFVQ